MEQKKIEKNNEKISRKKMIKPESKEKESKEKESKEKESKEKESKEKESKEKNEPGKDVRTKIKQVLKDFCEEKLNAKDVKGKLKELGCGPLPNDPRVGYFSAEQEKLINSQDTSGRRLLKDLLKAFPVAAIRMEETQPFSVCGNKKGSALENSLSKDSKKLDRDLENSNVIHFAENIVSDNILAWPATNSVKMSKSILPKCFERPSTLESNPVAPKHHDLKASDACLNAPILQSSRITSHRQLEAQRLQLQNKLYISTPASHSYLPSSEWKSSLRDSYRHDCTTMPKIAKHRVTGVIGFDFCIFCFDCRCFRFCTFWE